MFLRRINTLSQHILLQKANYATPSISKAKVLRNMLTSSDLEFIMEAHNGLSAKIVEETGFKGIWGSGLSVSASLGVRDNNEASYTQVLEVLEVSIFISQIIGQSYLIYI